MVTPIEFTISCISIFNEDTTFNQNTDMRRNRRCNDFQRLIESPSPVKENIDKNAIEKSETSRNKNFIRKLFSSNRSIKCDCQKKNDDGGASSTDEPLIQL